MNDKTTFIFGLVFAIVGCGVIGGGSYNMYQGTASEYWQKAGGRITESWGLYQNANLQGEMTGIHLAYTYTVAGKDYTGNRISFHISMSETLRRQILENCPEGQQIAVFYSAKDPTKAVLIPGSNTSDLALPMIGLVFLVAGIGTMIWAGRQDPKARRELALLKRAREEAAARPAPHASQSYSQSFSYPAHFFRPIGVVIMILMGSIVIGFAVIVAGIYKDDPDFPALIAGSGIFCLIGLSLILAAINIKGSKIIIKISGGKIAYTRKSLFGRKHFEAPLQDYLFIVPRRIVEADSFKGKSSPARQYRLVCADFIHRKDTKKDIRLRLSQRDYQQFDSEDADLAEIRTFAAAVSLPLVTL